MINEGPIAHYMSGGRISVPVTFHLLHGVRGGGAAQHSQSPQSMMANKPRLEIAVPSTPADVYGLVRSAFMSNNPTVIASHARLLGVETEVPSDKKPIPFGRAAITRRGKDVTVVANSLMTHSSLAAAEDLAKDSIDVEVVDLRTLAPLDEDTILELVARTGHLVVVDECPLRCGFASEVSATVVERGFDLLKAPIRRVTRAHVPVPYSAPLEAEVTPDPAKIAAAIRHVLGHQ